MPCLPPCVPYQATRRVVVVPGTTGALWVSLSGLFPLAWLHWRHTMRLMLATVSGPPRACGCMWSGSALAGVRVTS